MNLLLLQPNDLIDSDSSRSSDSLDVTEVGGRARIEGERLLHLRKVLRSVPGDALTAGLLNGPIGKATVLAIDPSGADLVLDLKEPPPAPLAVDLLLALPRPKFLGRILQHATTFGVKRIVLFASARVEKSYWSSNQMADTAIHRHLCLGLEQARDTTLPRVEQFRSFGELTRTAEQAHESGRSVLVADGAADSPFPRHPVSTATTLIIGPEGGLLEGEVATLAGVGATPVSLGDRALRVETAVSACLSRLVP